MNSISTAYINALLADASYVRIVNRAPDDSDIRDRLTPTQATYLAANFTVKASHQSPTGGFDAVVWEGKNGTEYAGKTFVSMRGTQGTQDQLDDGRLAASGVPNEQIVDMVNWWLRINAPSSNTNVAQIEYRPFASLDPLTGAVLLPAGFALSEQTVAGTGELASTTTIAGVNGHSLGGYLSTAFAGIFGNSINIQTINTYNSAGFSNVAAQNIKNSFDQIAVALNLNGYFASVDGIQKNYLGANGVNFTTNSAADIGIPGFNQYGQRIGLYQEDLPGGDLGPANNHSMYKLTDYLALGAVLGKLDSNLIEKTGSNLNFDKLNALIKAGSQDMKASYEGVLN